MAMIRPILISGLKIFIILAILSSIYIIFFQASISYISDHMYFEIYAGEQLMQHQWFQSFIGVYGYRPEAGPFRIKEKARFLVKKTYARFLQNNFVGYGEIDLTSIVKLLQNQISYNELFQQDQFFKKQFIPFNVYLAQDFAYIFFTLDISDIEYPLVLLTNDTAWYNNESDQNFVLVFKTNELLEAFEKQIKARLALHMPVEKSVILPDGSTFIEQIVDVDVFDFQDMMVNKKKVRHWEDENKSIVLWKDKNYIFVSNSLDLDQDIISMCFSNIKDEGFKQAIYVQLDAYGIENIIIGETDEKIKGCLTFNI